MFKQIFAGFEASNGADGPLGRAPFEAERVEMHRKFVRVLVGKSFKGNLRRRS